jgi:16S rRNA (uracil1498-N3)-methyltransferase
VRHTFRYLVEDPLAEGAEVVLGADDAHHLARVVRRRPGDAVELIDAAGGIWPAVVTALEPAARVRVTAAAPRTPPPARVTLYQGLVEWGRLDTVVEKAVELGAGEVVVFRSERARRVPDPEAWGRRRERLDRVAAAAARQCGRAPLPPVRGLVPFDRVPAEIPDGEGFLIDPRGDAALPAAIGAHAAPAARIALVVGPEAGFSADEVAAARHGGLAVCHLGSTVLRAETAAIAAVAGAASAAWGEGA